MRIYFRLLAALLVIAAIMATGGAAIILIVVTFGLGFPLVFSATGVLYLLCCFPAVAFWTGKTSDRLTGCGVSAFLIVLAALAPGYLGRQQAESGALTYQNKDLKPKAPVSVSSIEIRRSRSSYDGTCADSEACGFECRSILSAGQVKWLRVVMTDGQARRGQSSETSTRHSLLQGSDCAVPGGARNDSESCVVMVADDGATPELAIEVHAATAFKSEAKWFDLVHWRNTRRVTAELRRDRKSVV